MLMRETLLAAWWYSCHMGWLPRTEPPTYPHPSKKVRVALIKNSEGGSYATWR